MADYNPEIRRFLKVLRPYQHILTKQQMKTLKGQACSGDVQEALRGLNTILERRRCTFV